MANSLIEYNSSFIGFNIGKKGEKKERWVDFLELLADLLDQCVDKQHRGRWWKIPCISESQKLAKQLWEACCLSGSFPLPFPHFSTAEVVLEGVYSGWQAVGGDWPQITQHENSVHKISSRVLCIRRQGKMSHSAERRGERWNRKNWNGASYPPATSECFTAGWTESVPARQPETELFR